MHQFVYHLTHDVQVKDTAAGLLLVAVGVFSILTRKRTSEKRRETRILMGYQDPSLRATDAELRLDYAGSIAVGVIFVLVGAYTLIRCWCGTAWLSSLFGQRIYYSR